MPTKRNYKIKGTKDFLVLALIFFFLCIWAIKDAWYPSPKVMKKHPQEVLVSFSVSGVIGELNITEGDTVVENQVIGTLRQVSAEQQYEAAKNAFTEVKKQYSLLEAELDSAIKKGASDEKIAGIKQDIADTEAAKADALKKVNDERANLDATELKAPSKGEVLTVLAETHTLVEADQTVLVIDPKDHFYLFNKSLAIFSFIAFWVFLAIHFLAR